jgi:superfamily II DNA or RNA helicase
MSDSNSEGLLKIRKRVGSNLTGVNVETLAKKTIEQRRSGANFSIENTSTLSVELKRSELTTQVLSAMDQCILSGKARGVIEAPPRMGKTYWILEWAKKLLDIGYKGKIIITVPTRELLEQHMDTFANEYPDLETCELRTYNSKKYSHIQVLFTTYASLYNRLEKSTKTNLDTLIGFDEGVKAGVLDPRNFVLMADEGHHLLGSKTFQVIDTLYSKYPQAQLFSISATPDYGTNDGRNQQSLGLSHIFKVEHRPAIEAGYMAPFRAISVSVVLDDEISKVVESVDNANNETLSTEISRKIEKHTGFPNAISKVYFETVIPCEEGEVEHLFDRQTLIACNGIQTCLSVASFLNERWKEHCLKNNTTYSPIAQAVYGSMNDKERDSTMSQFNTGNLKVLVGDRILTEGLTFEEVYYTIDTKAGDSRVATTQFCSRAGGLSEENETKVGVTIQLEYITPHGKKVPSFPYSEILGGSTAYPPGFTSETLTGKINTPTPDLREPVVAAITDVEVIVTEDKEFGPGYTVSRGSSEARPIGKVEESIIESLNDEKLSLLTTRRYYNTTIDPKLKGVRYRYYNYIKTVNEANQPKLEILYVPSYVSNFLDSKDKQDYTGTDILSERVIKSILYYLDDNYKALFQLEGFGLGEKSGVTNEALGLSQGTSRSRVGQILQQNIRKISNELSRVYRNFIMPNFDDDEDYIAPPTIYNILEKIIIDSDISILRKFEELIKAYTGNIKSKESELSKNHYTIFFKYFAAMQLYAIANKSDKQKLLSLFPSEVVLMFETVKQNTVLLPLITRSKNNTYRNSFSKNQDNVSLSLTYDYYRKEIFPVYCPDLDVDFESFVLMRSNFTTKEEFISLFTKYQSSSQEIKYSLLFLESSELIKLHIAADHIGDFKRFAIWFARQKSDFITDHETIRSIRSGIVSLVKNTLTNQLSEYNIFLNKGSFQQIITLYQTLFPESVKTKSMEIENKERLIESINDEYESDLGRRPNFISVQQTLKEKPNSLLHTNQVLLIKFIESVLSQGGHMDIFETSLYNRLITLVKEDFVITIGQEYFNPVDVTSPEMYRLVSKKDELQEKLTSIKSSSSTISQDDYLNQVKKLILDRFKDSPKNFTGVSNELSLLSDRKFFEKFKEYLHNIDTTHTDFSKLDSFELKSKILSTLDYCQVSHVTTAFEKVQLAARYTRKEFQVVLKLPFKLGYNTALELYSYLENTQLGLENSLFKNITVSQSELANKPELHSDHQVYTIHDITSLNSDPFLTLKDLKHFKAFIMQMVLKHSSKLSLETYQLVLDQTFVAFNHTPLMTIEAFKLWMKLYFVLFPLESV